MAEYHLLSPVRRSVVSMSVFRALWVANNMLRHDRTCFTLLNSAHLPAGPIQTRYLSSYLLPFFAAAQPSEQRRVPKSTIRVCRVFVPGPDMCRNHETREYEHEEDPCFGLLPSLPSTCPDLFTAVTRQGWSTGYRLVRNIRLSYCILVLTPLPGSVLLGSQPGLDRIPWRPAAICWIRRRKARESRDVKRRTGTTRNTTCETPNTNCQTRYIPCT